VGEAKVIRVIDGDTIDVEIQGKSYRVRYIGIDTPETVHSVIPPQPLGAEATARNKELVDGKTVRLEKDVSETDSYDRLLRYVYVGDMCVNAELVKWGYAWASSYPPDTRYDSWFSTLQNEAKNSKRGLWSQLNVHITDLPLYVYRGKNANISIRTTSGSTCDIQVRLPSGSISTASGLIQKTAGSDGKVSWEWKIGSTTKPGTATITITASYSSETSSQQVTFEIKQ